ncbi:uncharacterized protein LOC124672153 [Lolium rigidum]|uniref:uncharacterized protein LOC124672153 n=1 Tax=Lolium rigidum TaxID=89674 RepID=UPI001F5D88D6|nr:uncharacterized protein LOC124672153 [Lolium rigidum]
MTAGRHGGRAGGRLHRLLVPEVRPEVLLPASSSSGNLARDLLMLATTRSRCIQDHSRQEIEQLRRLTVGCGRGSLCCRDGGGEALITNQCSPALAAAPCSMAGAAAAGVFRQPHHLLLPACTLSCYCLVRQSMKLFC